MVCQTITERSGGQFSSLDPNGDLTKQIAIFEDLIAMERDAVLFLPIDSAGVAPTIEKGADAGVPFFNTDHKAETDATICFSTHDQQDCGRQGGKYLIEWAQDRGVKLTIFEIWGSMGHEGAERRHAGYHEIFDQYPDIVERVIESPDTNWSTDNAMQFTLEALSSTPEINAICTHNNMIAGVCEALKVMDLAKPLDDPEHIAYVGIDCFGPSMDQVRAGFCDGIAVHSPWEEMDALTKAALLYVCCGVPVPKLVNFDSYLITIDNMDAVRFGAPMVWGDMFTAYPDPDDWPLLDLPEKYGVPIPTVDMKQPGY
jgi:ABC-type sugar transport system substrate-binding protein